MSQIPPPPHPPPKILCLQLSVLIIHWHCFQVSYASDNLSKKLICIQKHSPLLSEEISC